VSEDAARARYGVVLRDGAADVAATAALRAIREPVPDAGHFDFGDARRAFEAVWSTPRYDVLTRLLATQPVNWRHYLKRRFFAAVAAGEAAEHDLETQMARIGAALLGPTGHAADARP
jgi:N-methylhydantoinase B